MRSSRGIVASVDEALRRSASGALLAAEKSSAAASTRGGGGEASRAAAAPLLLHHPSSSSSTRRRLLSAMATSATSNAAIAGAASSSSSSSRALFSTLATSHDHHRAVQDGRSAAELLMGGILALATSVTVALASSYPDDGGGGGGVGFLDGGGGSGSAAAVASSPSGAGAGTGATSNITFHNSRRMMNSSSKGSSSSSSSSSVSKKPYDVSVRAIRGARYTMEDEFYVGDGGRFAAVFDGHGGAGVSQFLKKRLYDQVTHFIAEKHWEERDDDIENSTHSTANAKAKNQKPSVSCFVSALKAAFEKVEEEVLKLDSLDHVGSTACAVMIYEDEDEGLRTLLSANVGDSRAVLCRSGSAVDLTRDHKPGDEKEKSRILSQGDSIEWDNDCKVHRVRNLSLARAIGDRYAKPAVSAEVEIKHFPVCEEDEFIVLASDGLYDVMSSQEVVTYVKRQMESELAGLSKDNAESRKLVLRRNMANRVAREAFRKGSADNITVVMVWL